MVRRSRRLGLPLAWLLLGLITLSCTSSSGRDGTDSKTLASSPPVTVPSPVTSSADDGVDPVSSTAEAEAGDSEMQQTASASMSIVMTEIHYHPAASTEVEFLEFTNRTGEPIDISGWCVDGIDTCFGEGTFIDPSDVLVLSEPEFEGRLDNGGETIELRDSDGVVVDAVEYGDRATWPVTADGLGMSLHRRDLDAPADPGNFDALEPSPGSVSATIRPVRPSFSSVDHPTVPAASRPIDIAASIASSDLADTAVRVGYRIDFGSEQFIEADVDAAGRVSATIPPQPVDTLVEFRWIADSPDGQVGTWPRDGDSVAYEALATSPAVPPTDGRVVVRWFMPDDSYGEALADTTLSGDQGRAAAFAIGDAVVSGALVRVKGQSSREFFDKPKWHVSLPRNRGIDLAIDGEMTAVDEFDLQSSAADRSFVRELLAEDVLAAAGVPHPDMSLARLDRNGEFEGLYHLVEATDADWLRRVGLDDHAIFEVHDIPFDGTSFPAFSAELPDDEFAEIYERRSGSDQDDEDLRTMIRTLNGADITERGAWIRENVDVESVADAIAASVAMHHMDWGQKNYLLTRDPDGRWGVVLLDFDLTFGRRVKDGCFLKCGGLERNGELAWPDGPFFSTFRDDPALAEIVIGRSVEVLDEVYRDGQIVQRAIDLATEQRALAVLDREVWPPFDPTPFDKVVDELVAFIESHEAITRQHLARPQDRIELRELTGLAGS